MFILSKAFNLFKVQADADLSEASAFKTAFSNVVNLLMLVQSLVLGLRTLLSEDSVLSSVNLIFSLVFVTYFVMTYIVKVDRFINTIDRIAIFFYFIIIYITCSQYSIIGVTITIYPFIAIILSGRHVGAVLSFVQAAIVVAYYFVFVEFLGIASSSVFTLSGTLTIVLIQIINIFIYYVAVRWLSGLVYDKNREVAIINEDLATQHDLVRRLSACVDKPLRDISEASAVLVGERLNPMQSELSAIIRSSALNAINNVNAVRKASRLSIPIVPVEIIKFNIYTLLGNLLKLYRPKDTTRVAHKYSLGNGVPEILLGNSILTRQVFLNVMDALDAAVELGDCPMNVSANREDLVVKDILLRFTIIVDHDLEIDRREVTYHEGSLIDQLNLDVTKRIVESEGGFMTAILEDKKIKIEFTIKYQPAVGDEIDPELVRSARAALNVSVPMRQASLLIVTEDDNLWLDMTDSLRQCFAQVKRAQSRERAIRVFTSSLIDAVIVDTAFDPDCGARLLASLRDAESGLVRKVPVIGLVDPSSMNSMSLAAVVGYDVCVTLPYNSIETIDVLRGYFS